MPIGSHNYCRQPETDGSGAWCYVDHPNKWQFCDIPECEQVDDPAPGSSTSYDCQDLSLDHKGSNYIGNISRTASGKTCQDWNKISI